MGFTWLGLYFDSHFISTLYSNSQWLTNILIIPLFFWVYSHASKQIKQLMLFGLGLGVAGELLFSLLLGMYTYRLENLPFYIPFGHSLIYASVYYIVKEPLIIKHHKSIIKFLYIAIIIYSSAWLLFDFDVLGFLGMLIILYIFKRRPHIKLFFLVMFFMIVYLELIGTHYQCWSWPDTWFGLVPFVPSTNPPSGISVFYFGFDAGCLWLYKKTFPHKWKRFQAIHS